MTQRPRTPGMVYSAAALGLVLLLAALALTQRQPPPPTIAEFAPQVVENITDAPSDQSSSSGRSGGLGGQSGSPGPESGSAPSLAAIDVPRVRRCVGDPPRQIEDPQSPPCVPYWTGDNGGATWRGVTRDEIRVAYPNGKDENNDRNCGTNDLRLESFFNRHFEFYGRKLRLYCFGTAGGQGSSSADVENMNADVAKVSDQIGAFASTDYEDRGGAETVYYDGLAKRNIVSVDQRAFADEAHLERFAPYQWRYHAGSDRVGRNLAEYACKTLSGLPAEHAGTAESGRTRRFGLIVEHKNGVAPDAAPLLDGLGACGVRPETVQARDPVTEGTNILLKMRDAGVTSIMCRCVGFDISWFKRAAQQQGYQPEWVITSEQQGDEEFYSSGFAPAEQNRHQFGLSFWNKRLSVHELPTYWALNEENPGNAFNSSAGESGGLIWNYEIYGYKPLLMLASGLQLAGPRLTPDTFQQGLLRAKFPNPGAGGAPWYQAAAGFGPGDRTMNQDASIIWWTETKTGFLGAPGSWCYVSLGTRYDAGRWPSGRQPLFDLSKPCR